MKSVSHAWLYGLSFLLRYFQSTGNVMAQVTERKEISLPAPDITGDAFLEYLLQERRSVREYQNAGLSLAHGAQ